MKKLTILFIALIVSGQLTAATDKGPFFPQGTTWTEAWFQHGAETDQQPVTTYEVGADTLINDTLYHRVLVDGVESGKWLREENQCVYLRRNDFPKEIMLYNFDWWNDNYQYYKTTVRQYIQHGELLADTFFIDKRGSIQYESQYRYESLAYIQFEYFDFDAVKMLRGIGMTEEPYKDCCVLGTQLPDEMEPSTKHCRLLTFSRGGNKMYDFKSQFAKCEIFTRNMPPTAGVDVWFYSLWDGLYKEDYICLDSISGNRIYVSAHYNTEKVPARDVPSVCLGSFEAGDYQLLFSAVDHSMFLPDIITEIPMTVHESPVDVPRGLVYLPDRTYEEFEGYSEDYTPSITVRLENSKLRITGWLLFTAGVENYCYYEVHGDTIYLETAEEWNHDLPTGWLRLYPVDLTLRYYGNDRCVLQVSEVYLRSYTKEGYYAKHSLSHTLTYKLTSVPSPLLQEGQEGGFYDLTGRPVDGTQKGILIRNRKKVLIR